MQKENQTLDPALLLSLVSAVNTLNQKDQIRIDTGAIKKRIETVDKATKAIDRSDTLSKVVSYLAILGLSGLLFAPTVLLIVVPLAVILVIIKRGILAIIVAGIIGYIVMGVSLKAGAVQLTEKVDVPVEEVTIIVTPTPAEGGQK